jgi:hypothetical protein
VDRQTTAPRGSVNVRYRGSPALVSRLAGSAHTDFPCRIDWWSSNAVRLAKVRWHVPQWPVRLPICCQRVPQRQVPKLGI